MKKSQKTDIEGMIMGAHYLHALDKEAQAQKPLSEMERQDYIDQINSLKETVSQFKEMIALLKQALESSEESREQAQKQNETLQTQVRHFQGIISNLSKEISLLRDEVSKQTDYNKRHNKMSFGKKSLSSRTKQDDKKSREEAKMEHDGSGTSTNTDLEKSEKGKSENPSDEVQDSSLDRTKVKSENLDKERGPRGLYTPMEAARVIRLKQYWKVLLPT